MNVLFIGPLPPPVTGQSLACRILLDELQKSHAVAVVDLARAKLTSGFGSPAKCLQTLGMLKAVWRLKNDADVIYLTISESAAGNIKDLLIYAMCRKRLSRFIVHLHGGSLKRALFDRCGALARANRIFLTKIGVAVILGESHRQIFEGYISTDRVRIVPNFAEDRYFLDRSLIAAKHSGANGIRVLFLSNLISGKGYEDLVDAYFAMSASTRSRVAVDFAGEFESDIARKRFLQRIDGCSSLRYHGVVAGKTKKALLDGAHVFCLPTRLTEGQPISILEAYAAGAVVITSAMGGIPDIFREGVNGFSITPGEPSSLAAALARAATCPEALLPIALRNSRAAEAHYRSARYARDLLRIFNEIAPGAQAPPAAKAAPSAGR